MKKSHNPTFIVVLVLLLMVISFIMGRLSLLDYKAQEISIISATDIRQNTPKQDVTIRASSRGSKYYYPWCQSSFNEGNTIYFENNEEAESAGYELATDCIAPIQ